MKYVAFSLIVLLFSSFLASAVELESLSLGVHFIPAVEQVTGARHVDVSFSFGGTLILDSANRIEFMAMLDSTPTSLGTSVQYDHQVTDPLAAGGGFTVMWPFSADLHLQWPILSLYAHAEARTYFYPEFWAESGISFPLVTLANEVDGWKLLPLSELPTLYVAADARIANEASIQPRVTFQPVITDTTVLQNPIGRVSDDLLVLPMGSLFLRYVR